VSGAVAVEVLRLLQQQLLVAAIAQTPLPGQGDVLRFPDLALLLERPERIVSRENLAEGVDPGIAVVFLSDAEITERVKRAGDLPALGFRPVEKLDDGHIRLTLELRMYFVDVEPLPLGAIIATFAEVPGGGWQVADRPAALGY